jgi:hypothetical protein
MNKDTLYMLDRVKSLGVSLEDALALRRISMTLHRWHELECGNSDDYKSYCVTRGHKNKEGFEYADDGKPYLETHYYHNGNGVKYYPIPDRETGANKRLAKIMAKYPTLQAYVQGDPRGASLYILRPGDVPDGEDVNAYYSRGIAVYK